MKAANLLIDDDGTVLLGDLGVAADLSEGSSHTLSSLSSNNEPAVDQKAASHATPSPSNRVFNDSTPPSKAPRIGKRKSFVGTVSVTRIFAPFSHEFVMNASLLSHSFAHDVLSLYLL